MISLRKENVYLWTAIAVVTLLTCFFGIYQNSGDRLGGQISQPKVLWLNFAFIMFFVIPGALSRQYPAYRLVLASFLIRALVEGYLLLFTDAWRCWMGISHNLITLLLFLRLFPKENRGFSWLLVAALLIETVMAAMFSVLADPAEGTYFASNESMFHGVNRFTWMVIAIVYPCLIGALFSFMKENSNDKEALV